VLQDALDVRDRVAAREISAHGAAVARGHLLSRLLDLLAAPGTVPDCQRLAAHLTTELPAVFGFLFDFTLDATNWRAEQALRPAVVNRKVSGGNRSERGAETQQILSGIVQTARLRDLDPRDVLVGLLRSPRRQLPPRSPRFNSLTPANQLPIHELTS
jgi:transposase